ncbi:hypothetical protein COCMIDRAFT_35039 [Bipolaris oryzae ATCC 44560]|uniref:UBC core domain-containing protein n=1 Tax=Bipolaris oryzae ATCC 44560 TaxID=930090 RepID=W6Z6Z4_COCMI|nr:uncharacterized protein COCMIDRAFT_35039 [Bipolaris oryzae ATCC 44560]EUC47512.1 hypothetical protein COCMIDRAFT_35039 [Bipolaris oryzae ATCC 44560]
MNSKSLRRLAADHGSLHTAGLPPNYLFAPESDDAADLTSLDILLAGPVGTPYAGGVWRLHLDIPPTYPAAPPTAQFRTRLWHPNIDEATGAVCVETLKRDWSSTLKLRDVLVTISCLLIQPNPASALNEAAGKLAVEDWDGYCRRAKLMTEIHAAIPSSIAKEVREAQMRGEERTTESEPQSEPQPQPTAKLHSKGKEKERVKITPAGPRLQRRPSEDEENRRRRAATHDADSDPESDWIPGPVKTSKVPGRHESNIFGIKGLDDTMQLDTPPKRIFAAQNLPKDKGKAKGATDDSDPFLTTTTAPQKSISRPVTRSFDLAPPPPALATSTRPAEPSHPTGNEESDNSTTLLLRDFSLSWHDTFALHNNDPDAKKRIASPEFEAKAKWEMKRFRQAAWDLEKFNRGEFGPRVGVGRL